MPTITPRYDMAQRCYTVTCADGARYHLGLPRYVDDAAPIFYGETFSFRVEAPERFGPWQGSHFAAWARRFATDATV